MVSGDTETLVVFFDDMRGSTALKESFTAQTDEQTFQRLRQEHDALLTEIITRNGDGEVIKSTGDGLLAVFFRPSVAVERAIEIQDRLHGHPFLKVRIGMDMGEVRVEYADGRRGDVFGRHVDWAARAMSMADAGHICVTQGVYTDAYSWITKSRIAWKEHGGYRLKPGEPALQLFEPYNANIVQCMSALGGERADLPPTPRRATGSLAAVKSESMRIVRSWELVARDGREFAENGSGMMYWFKAPLGGISFPEGFRNFLQPALENPRITKIRFLLDGSVPVVHDIWNNVVLGLVRGWAEKAGRTFTEEKQPDGGKLVDGKKELAWIFEDLSTEFSPCFKIFIDDPDDDHPVDLQAQIFLSTASRVARLGDGSKRSVRIPDVVLRLRADEHDSLLHALNTVANQWDPLFC